MVEHENRALYFNFICKMYNIIIEYMKIGLMDFCLAMNSPINCRMKSKIPIFMSWLKFYLLIDCFVQNAHSKHYTISYSMHLNSIHEFNEITLASDDLIY